MTNLERLLSQYAAYHLDRNNIVTHFVGIPLYCFFYFVFNGTCRYRNFWLFNHISHAAHRSQ